MVRLPERHAASARWSRRMATFAVPLGALTTVLHRFGQIETPVALFLLGLTLAMALLALGFGLWGLLVVWRRGGHGALDAFIGVVVALAVLAWPVWHLTGLGTRPRLNDVTTDWQQPPEFQAATEDRPEWAGAVGYRSDLAARQAAAYPEIVPVFLSYDADLVFDLAMALVSQRRWRVLAAQPPAGNAPGRIEAVARTLVFGFEDDVALRITSRGGERTRIDMRSASRFGAHDLGTNAQRIYDFLTDLQALLEEETAPAPLGGVPEEG